MAKSFSFNWVATIAVDVGNREYQKAVASYGQDVADKIVEISNGTVVADRYSELVIWFCVNEPEIVRRVRDCGLQLCFLDRSTCAPFGGLHSKVDFEIACALNTAAWPIEDEDGRFTIGVNVDAMKHSLEARTSVAAMVVLVNMHNRGNIDMRTGANMPTEEELLALTGWLPRKAFSTL